MLPRPLYIPEYSGYSRRRSRSRRNSRRPKPEYERNIVSAFFALASAVLLAIAEAEPRWLKIIGGKCSGKYIGLYKVIAYKSPEDLSGFCFTSTMVLVLRVIVALSCTGIVFSMFACLLDLCGTMNRCLKVIKDYSIGNVISAMQTTASCVMEVDNKPPLISLYISVKEFIVLMCAIISFLTYWVTRIVEANNTGDDKTQVKVHFDISFYLVAAAGVSSVLATGLSLVMHCHLQRSRERTRSDDDMSLELMYSLLPADSMSDMPPPAYSP